MMQRIFCGDSQGNSQMLCVRKSYSSWSRSPSGKSLSLKSACEFFFIRCTTNCRDKFRQLVLFHSPEHPLVPTRSETAVWLYSSCSCFYKDEFLIEPPTVKFLMCTWHSLAIWSHAPNIDTTPPHRRSSPWCWLSLSMNTVYTVI